MKQYENRKIDGKPVLFLIGENQSLELIQDGFAQWPQKFGVDYAFLLRDDDGWHGLVVKPRALFISHYADTELIFAAYSVRVASVPARHP